MPTILSRLLRSSSTVNSDQMTHEEVIEWRFRDLKQFIIEQISPLKDVPRVSHRDQQLIDAAKEGRVIELDYPVYTQRRAYETTRAGARIEHLLQQGLSSYSELLESATAFSESFLSIKNEPTNKIEPFWLNGWIGVLDGLSIYTLIRTRKPKTYFEIGSGNSTKFARKAIVDGGLSTQLVSIDPMPRSEIDSLCDRIVRKPVEEISEHFWCTQLSDGDVLFVDNSHRSFQSSDVTVFFTEILTLLPKGVTWGIHDIFLPEDYPEEWSKRYYNEQYLMASYLLGGGGNDEVVFPAYFMSRHPLLTQRLELMFNSSLPRDKIEGTVFWMRRK